MWVNLESSVATQGAKVLETATISSRIVGTPAVSSAKKKEIGHTYIHGQHGETRVCMELLQTATDNVLGWS